MRDNLKYTLMIAGMVISWSIYYAVSKVMVNATGSALLAGFLLRSAALVFLTIQLLADGSFSRLFHQGKAVFILVLIGVFGFLLDLFANLGYANGSLSTGTALLKTDVLMVNLATVFLYKKKLYFSDWVGTVIMLIGVLLVLGVDFDGIELHVVVLLLFGFSAAAAGHFKPGWLDSVKNLWWLIALGGLAQTGIYFFYYRNLKHFEVWIVKLYLLLMPVVSCFIGVFFLHEELTPKKLLGILVVLAGAAVILMRGKINHEKPQPNN